MTSDVARLPLTPHQDHASDVALLVQPVWPGQLVCKYRWRRIDISGSKIAQFVPEPHEVASEQAQGSRSAARAPSALIRSAVLSDTVSDEDHVQLALLRLFAHGTPPGHGVPVGPFELQHSIIARTCAVNGNLTHEGRREPLQGGDEVQVGMLRLSFVAPQALDDWFAPALQGVREAPTRGADWVGACEVAGQLPFGIHDALADATPGADVRDLSERLAKKSGAVEWDSEEAVLVELHQRYHVTLGDPAEMGAQTQWRDGFWDGPDMGPVPDPLDALLEKAGGYASLHDMLAAPDTMNTLIARADALGEGDMLSDVRVESVLHLFAPPSVQGPRTGDDDGLAELMHREFAPPDKALSSLTRREHHMPAADSALRLNHGGKDVSRD